jgi:hypothetical protein
VGLRILPLSRLDPLWPEFPSFILDVLEVVDSPTESPKICCHTNQTGAGSSCSIWENQTVRFGKSDGLILLISTAVRALSTLNEEATPPAKRRLDGR